MPGATLAEGSQRRGGAGTFCMLAAQLQGNRRGCTPPRRWREARAAHTCGSYRLERLRARREPKHEDATQHGIEDTKGCHAGGALPADDTVGAG